jgi:hypothetical protein
MRFLHNLFSRYDQWALAAAAVLLLINIIWDYSRARRGSAE